MEMSRQDFIGSLLASEGGSFLASAEVPAVNFRNIAVKIDNGNHYRSREVFVATFADDAELLQPSSDLGAFPAVSFRQMISKRSIGKTQAEAIDHFRMIQAAGLKILQSFRALLQDLVVIVDYLLQSALVVDARFKQRFELHG